MQHTPPIDGAKTHLGKETYPPSDTFVLSIPPKYRLINAAGHFVFAGIVVFSVILLVLQELILPGMAPPKRFDIASGLAVPFAFFISWRRYKLRYHTVTLDSSRLEIQRGNSVEAVRPAKVMALYASPGISLEGGELLVWKRLIVLTNDGRRVIAFDPEDNANCYRYLMRICSQAWGIPFRGKLEGPSQETSIESGTIAFALARLKRYVLREVVKSFLIALALIIGSSVATLFVFKEAETNPEAVQAVIWFIVLFVIGFLILGNLIRQIGILRQIRRENKMLHRNLLELD